MTFTPCRGKRRKNTGSIKQPGKASGYVVLKKVVSDSELKKDIVFYIDWYTFFNG
jgi:hypothetical protein